HTCSEARHIVMKAHVRVVDVENLLFLFTHVRATLEAMTGSPSMPSRQCAPHSLPPSPSLVPRLPRWVRAVPLLPMLHLLSGSVPPLHACASRLPLHPRRLFSVPHPHA